jgi:hypothetical protein
MCPKFFNRPSSRAMMNKLFLCLNYIKNKVVNNMPMSTCRTMHNVYPPILGNLLTKI